MAKRLLILVFLLISFFAYSTGNDNSSAEKTTNTTNSSLHGLVVDEETGEPVIGAKVEIVDAGVKLALTDFDGAFDFQNVLPGKYSLAVSYVSYEEKKLIDFECKAGSNQVIIQLKP